MFSWVHLSCDVGRAVHQRPKNVFTGVSRISRTKHSKLCRVFLQWTSQSNKELGIHDTKVILLACNKSNCHKLGAHPLVVSILVSRACKSIQSTAVARPKSRFTGDSQTLCTSANNHVQKALNMCKSNQNVGQTIAQFSW